MDMLSVTHENSIRDPKVLLIENDTEVIRMVMSALESDGIQFFYACDGATGLSMKAKLNPDIVLLGLRLSDVNVLDLASKLIQHRDCGLVVLCDQSAEAARDACLDFGAADYLALPTAAWDVVARVRAVHRRASRQSPSLEDPSTTLTVGPIRINLRHRSVHTLDGRRLALTSAEYTTLETLANADGHAVSRDRLSEAALRRPWRAEDRSVDQLVFNLRQKLPPDIDRGSLIQSIRGSGYWMRAPDRPARSPLDFASLGRVQHHGSSKAMDAAKMA